MDRWATIAESSYVVREVGASDAAAGTDLHRGQLAGSDQLEYAAASDVQLGCRLLNREQQCGGHRISFSIGGK
jgi:hypothetical protein